MKNKPWNLCRVYMCRRKTRSKKRERDIGKRYCHLHDPKCIAKRTVWKKLRCPIVETTRAKRCRVKVEPRSNPSPSFERRCKRVVPKKWHSALPHWCAQTRGRCRKREAVCKVRKPFELPIEIRVHIQALKVAEEEKFLARKKHGLS